MIHKRLTPGHVPGLCRHCVHQADTFLPIACLKVRWEGAKNVKPILERGEGGEVRCGDFEAVWRPMAPVPQADKKSVSSSCRDTMRLSEGEPEGPANPPPGKGSFQASLA